MKWGSILSRVALATGLAFASSAGADYQEADWLTGQEAESALEIAQERNIPIAVLYTSWETS